MDLMIIKVLDIVISEDTETGEQVTKKLYLPTYVYKKDVEDVHPGVASSGRLYKNISTLSTYSGANYTIIGNYKDINKRLNKDDRPTNIGYMSKKK